MVLTPFSVIFVAIVVDVLKAVGGADVLPPRLNLCCFHSLSDNVRIAVHKADNAVVILGVLVAHTSALRSRSAFSLIFCTIRSCTALRLSGQT